jgi:transcriptional regulator with XRE-family HTH domain
MKIRKKEYGNANMVGKRIEKIRKAKGIKQKDFIAKMQVMGCDINPTSYSKLEGQLRSATDREIYTVSKILNIKMEELFDSMGLIKTVRCGDSKIMCVDIPTFVKEWYRQLRYNYDAWMKERYCAWLRKYDIYDTKGENK